MEKFYIKKQKELGEIPVEYDPTQQCQICEGANSYWIGSGNSVLSICKDCILELAKLLE